MFEESLVESTPLLRTRSRAPLYTSIAIQAAIAAALLAIPVLHPEVLQLHAPALTLFAPPPQPTRPPTPPPQRVHMEASTSSTTAAPTTAPRINQTLFKNPTGESVDTPSIPVGPFGPTNPNLPATWSTAPSGPAIAVAPAAPKAAAGPVRLTQGVTAGMLLAPIRPTYPQIAKITGTQGIVIVQAIISTTGHIESAHVLSGPPLLQASALEAVRSARYRPYLLNNQPTTVETTITITFRLGA